MTDDKTLNRNVVKKFILRIDLIPNEKFKIIDLVNGLAKFVDRVESRAISNFSIHFTQTDSEVTTNQVFDHVLVAESRGYTVTISEAQNAIIFESNSYKDNSTYKQFIDQLHDVLIKFSSDITSKRIGLRYINEFNCETLKAIPLVFGKRLSTIVKNAIKDEFQTRAIGLEEYNNQDFKTRIQYGIPNKHYPSNISRPDLLLDIDCYNDTSTLLSDWPSIIRTLNHAAYSYFISEINPKILDKLK
jgi:uncharacterized protein (TIGR04255 family)